MIKNTTQDIVNINSFYSRDLLFRAVPRLVHNRFAQIKNTPANNSTTISFKRLSNLPVATTPLQEGVTPVGRKMTETVISAVVQQYGDYMTLTDKLTMTSEDPVRMEANVLLGQQSGNTLDQLTRDVMVTGTNVVYAGSGHTLRSQVAATEVITTAMVDAAELTLNLNNSMQMTSYVDASTGYSTAPLPPCYIGICHVAISPKIRAFTGFVKPELYAQASARMDGEIGKYGYTRFIETTNAKIFTGAGASSIDVYATLILAMYAYGTTAINGNSLVNIVKPLGSAGSADPLDQRETTGWKATFVAKILNDDFIVRLEHARV